MTDFKPEKLIPFIQITRKLRACDPEHQLDIIKQLPQMFESHGQTCVLAEIIFSGICNPKFYEKSPAALLIDIESALPSDDVLDLEDSISESRLLEMPDSTDEEPSSSKQIEKLPLSLLRIPNDIQIHLFHFLNYKDLISAQKVCRALCIGARNPSSLYSLDVDRVRVPENHVFLKECYSRPRSLSITARTSWDPETLLNYIQFTANAKWGQHVRDLLVKPTDGHRVEDEVNLSNFGNFVNLTKCEIQSLSSVLKNGHIPSYYTLRHLILKHIDFTEDIIDEIRKFKNLQKLTINECSYDQANTDIDLVSLRKLQEISFPMSYHIYPWWQLIERILIGSHPPIVNIEAIYTEENSIAVPTTDAMVQAIRAIKCLNIKAGNMHFVDALCPLLNKAKMLSGPYIPECNVSYLHRACLHVTAQDILTSITCLFQCAKSSTLRMTYRPSILDESSHPRNFVTGLCNTQLDTFTELMVDMEFDIWSCATNSSKPFIRNIFKSLGADKCWKRDREAVKNELMRGIDAAEQWMKPWLVLDEERMRQIGLRKMDIKFRCNVGLTPFQKNLDLLWRNKDKARRFANVLHKIADVWIQQRVDQWQDIDQRCIVVVGGDGLEYTVSLLLRA